MFLPEVPKIGSPYSMSRRGVLAAACLIGLALAGCAHGPAGPTSATPRRTLPAASATAPPGPADGPVNLGDAAAYAVIARGDVTVRSTPAAAAPALLRIPAKLRWGTPTPFLVHQARRVDGKLWYWVLLPQRPNQSSGWVPADQVRVSPRDRRADVDLSARRLTLYQGSDAVGTFPIAIGQPATPTPTGRFFVTVRLRPPQISTIYGAWALGLSAYSEVLDQFGTGDGQIALHGTNHSSELGRAITHGCVRLDNASISKLAALLPPGSPVDIHA
jgi:lipoprotein-anchoring transpeptidase ErfK/SrfK